MQLSVTVANSFLWYHQQEKMALQFARKSRSMGSNANAKLICKCGFSFQFSFCCFCLLNYEKEINFTKCTPINSVTVRRHVSRICFKHAWLLVPEMSLFGLNFLSLKHSSPFIDSKHSAKVQLVAFSGYHAIGPKQPTSLLADWEDGLDQAHGSAFKRLAVICQRVGSDTQWCSPRSCHPVLCCDRCPYVLG